MPRSPVAYSKSMALRFCALLSESDCSTMTLLASHPGEFPTLRTLYNWRDRYPAFARAWEKAKEAQAEFLMQTTIDLARHATKENAHAVRVKFDIFKFRASKILSNIYGDKPCTSISTTVNTLVVSPERLQAIRANLDRARANLKDSSDLKRKPSPTTSPLSSSTVLTHCSPVVSSPEPTLSSSSCPS